MLMDAKQLVEVSKFVATGKDNRDAIKCVRIDPGRAVAADGHVLIIATASTMPGEEYFAAEPIEKPILATPEQIKQAAALCPKQTRNSLPITSVIQAGTVDGNPVLSAGMPRASIPAESNGDDFPKYEQVIPDYTDKQSIRFALDARLLKKVCEYAAKFGDSITGMIEFEIPTLADDWKKDEDGYFVRDENGETIMERQPITKLASAVKFRIHDPYSGNEATGVIMPLRLGE